MESQPKRTVDYLCCRCGIEVGIPWAFAVLDPAVHCPACGYENRSQIQTLTFACPHCKQAKLTANYRPLPDRDRFVTCPACGKQAHVPWVTEPLEAEWTHQYSPTVQALVDGSHEALAQVAGMLWAALPGTESEKYTFRRWLCDAMRCRGAELIPNLVENVQTSEERVKWNAVEVLGWLGDMASALATEPLMELLPSDHSEVNWGPSDDAQIARRGTEEAIRALGRIGDVRAREPLERIVQTVVPNSQWLSFRVAAAEALGDLGGAASIPVLLAAVAQETEPMLVPVTRALARLDPGEAAGMLLGFAGDPSLNKDVVNRLTNLVVFHSVTLPSGLLEQLARLDGVQTNIYRSTEEYGMFVVGQKAVDCSVLRTLAREELERRGVRARQCFIATAACGHEDAADVVLLRRLRDEVLLGSSGGQWAVQTYERFSPPLASVVGRWGVLRTIARFTVVWPAARMAAGIIAHRGQQRLGRA